MSRWFPNNVEVLDSTVGTTATEVIPAGDGTTHVTVINDDGANTLYVGWDSSVSSTASTHFIGGDLGASESITLTDYAGPIWLEGSGADTDYRVERRYMTR